MNTRRFLSAVLIVATVLLFVSCGGLASSKHQTGNFTFTINPVLADTIAREAGNGNIAIKVTVTSTDEVSYTPNPIEKTVCATSGSVDEIKTALVGIPFVFENVPLNIELCLNVEMKINGLIRFVSNTQQFTLTEKGATTIEAKLYSVLNTPIVLYGEEGSSFYRATELSSDENGYITEPDFVVDDVSYGEFWCTDSAGTLYTIDDDDDELLILCYPLSGSNSECKVSFDGFGGEDTLLFGLCYDPIKNKIVTYIINILDTGSPDPNGYCYQFTPGTLPEELTLSPTTAGVTTLEKQAYFDTLSEGDYPVVLSAFNGNLYSLLSWDEAYYIPDPDDDGIDEAVVSPSITLRVQSLSDGTWIKDAAVTIPDAHPDVKTRFADNGEAEYVFNDMYVDENGVYVLFHQLEVTHKEPYITYSDTSEPPSPNDWVYIDRGGIIVLDAATLSQKAVIAVPETKLSMDNLPLRINHTSGYPNAYADSDLTINLTTSIPVTWAVAEPEKGFLANPQKIVAIKPKKLIIADSGAFMYSSNDWFMGENEGTTYKYSSFDSVIAETQTATRLVEVDLESFAVHEVAKIPSEAQLYTYQMPRYFAMIYNDSIDIGESVYGHKLNQVTYQHGTAYEVLPEGTVYDNSYSLTGEIIFGEFN